jgi:ferric-dicitrate binding protein FerR (iron transport regulator)
MKKIHKERQIYALIDGRLSDGQREKLERHLDECADCRAFLEEARSLRGELRSLGSAEPSNVDWQSAWNLIEASSRSEESRRARAPQEDVTSFFWRLALAGGAALLIFGLYVVYDQSKDAKKDVETALTVTGPGLPSETGLADTAGEGPLAATVTVTGGSVEWSLPGISPKPLDIETVLREGAQVCTASGAAAGIQVGRATGIRIEPASTVTLARLNKDEIALKLDEGTLSVDFRNKEEQARLTVRTGEADVTVKGTLFSVSRKDNATAVVVGRGMVLVTPLENEKSAVSVKKREGVRVSSTGTLTSIDAEAEGEAMRLEKALFNIFEQAPSDEIVTIDVKGNGDFEGVVLGEKHEPLPQLTLRKQPGDLHAAVLLKSEVEIPLLLPAHEGKKGSITFDLAGLSKNDREYASAKSKKTSEAAKETALAVETGAGEEEASGTIDPFLVKVKIYKEKGQLRSCYEKYLDTNPEEKKVKARIGFTVGTSGMVTQAACTCNVQNKALKTCLEEAIKSITFPKPDGGPARFEYPVSFTPK